MAQDLLEARRIGNQGFQVRIHLKLKAGQLSGFGGGSGTFSVGNAVLGLF